MTGHLYVHRCRLVKREGAWGFRCGWCRYGGLVRSWRQGIRAALRHAEAHR